MPPRDKRRGNYGQTTGIYDNRYHLEQMVLHHFYREALRQTDIASMVGTSIGVVHKIINTVELKDKPSNPTLKPYVFNLEEMPTL